MIVVVGSRHDLVAQELVASWPDAALCSAEDLVRPGWVWRYGRTASRTWVVDTKRVCDDDVTGVFVRRPTVYPEELTSTHPEDRPFLASEIHSFLTFVLATTSARVVNPVSDGAFGEEALRPHRWVAAASEVGISIRPLRVTSEPGRQTRYRTCEVQVVGDEIFGDVPRRFADSARRLAQALGIGWAIFLFDAQLRLVTVTAARRPSNEAVAALAHLLQAGRT